MERGSIRKQLIGVKANGLTLVGIFRALLRALWECPRLNPIVTR